MFANSQSQTLSSSVFSILSKDVNFLSEKSKFVSSANRKKSKFFEEVWISTLPDDRMFSREERGQM